MTRFRLLAVCSAALLVHAPLLGAQQGRDDATFTWTGKLTAGSTVVIRNGNGPITVRESGKASKVVVSSTSRRSRR